MEYEQRHSRTSIPTITQSCDEVSSTPAVREKKEIINVDKIAISSLFQEREPCRIENVCDYDASA